MKPLGQLAEQFSTDAVALDALRTRHADAVARLSALETDHTLDLDLAADESAKLAAEISAASFKIESMTRRQNALRDQIVSTIDRATHEHRAAEKATQRERRAMAEELIESDEFQRWVGTLKALFAAGDFYSWQSLLDEVIPRHCNRAESRRLATELGIWLDEPPADQDVKFACSVIGYQPQRL